VWAGLGSLAGGDGRVGVFLRDQAAVLLQPPGEAEDRGPVHTALLAHLRDRGASFWADLYREALHAHSRDRGDRGDQGASGGIAGGLPEAEVLAALWDLVWEGLVTNDTFQALRALSGGPLRRGGSRRA